MKEPPARNRATDYITMQLEKVSELASGIIWLSSQKKCEISKMLQKASHNTIKFSNKEFRTLMIQDTSTSSPQGWGFMMTV